MTKNRGAVERLLRKKVERSGWAEISEKLIFVGVYVMFSRKSAEKITRIWGLYKLFQ